MSRTITLLLAAALLAGCGRVAAVYSARAEAAHARQDYKAEAEHLSKAIALEPHFTLHLRRAIAYLKLGELDAAEPDIETALKYAPSRTAEALVLARRAELKRRRGLGREALADYELALDRERLHDPEVLLARADAWVRWGEARMAEIDYREAAERARGLATAFDGPMDEEEAKVVAPLEAQLAESSRKDAQVAEAAEKLAQAISPLPFVPPSEPFEGPAGATPGIPPAVKEELARALLDKAGTVDGFGKSLKYPSGGMDFDRDIDRALAIAPKMKEAHLLRARLYAKQLLLERAERRKVMLASAKAALELDPKDAEARALVADLEGGR